MNDETIIFRIGKPSEHDSDDVMRHLFGITDNAKEVPIIRDRVCWEMLHDPEVLKKCPRRIVITKLNKLTFILDKEGVEVVHVSKMG